MAIFLDTAKIEEIEKFLRMGIIRGITTNPTIILKDGIQGGINETRAYFTKIAKLIYPLPLSLEITTNDPKKMLIQAKELSALGENIVVKVPIHGPDGELENLEVIHKLEGEINVRVNVTAMMSAQQCLLAAMAGASYVSIFGGRINNMGYNCIEEIKKTRELVDDFKLKAQIIVGSTREILNVVEWLIAGAHIVTVLPDLLKGMILHPYTKETVKMFLEDALKIEVDDAKNKSKTS